MAREYFCAYHSLLESLTPYGDAEVGRLFRACLQYSMTGEDPDLRGNERFIWPTLKQGIDRDKSSYEATCLKNRENGSKGGRPPKNRENQPVYEETQKSQEEGEGKGEEEGKGDFPHNPVPAEGRAGTYDPVLGKVVSFFMDHVNPTPSPIAIGDIQFFLYQANLDADVMIHAMQIAIDERKNSWSYIKAILQRYANNGLNTMLAVLNDEQQRAAARASGNRQVRSQRPSKGQDAVSDLLALHSRYKEES